MKPSVVTQKPIGYGEKNRDNLADPGHHQPDQHRKDQPDGGPSRSAGQPPRRAPTSSANTSRLPVIWLVPASGHPRAVLQERAR